jgi:hypothetical protein
LATVITNLISAIPWIGQDIVESKKNLEFLNYYRNLLFINSILLIPKCYPALPKLGIPYFKSRINRSKWLSEKEYLSIPKSFLAFLVGFIDGDGHINIRKNQNTITMNLTLSIHLDDIAILNYIQSVLKIGKIYIYSSRKSPTVRLVFNRTELQEILFPLLVYNNIFFLTENRRAQYHMALYIFNNNIRYYKELPHVAPIIQELPTRPEGYVNLEFFTNWIVGFVVAEGSFFIKNNNDGCFQIKQKFHFNLFYAFKLIFKTNRKITIDQTMYSQFGVSSKADIQEVINFFSFSGFHPLVGLKSIQYSIWLDKLRNSERYNKLNFPNI